MAGSCSFADEASELKSRSARDRDIINQIIHQIIESAYFIRDYCRDKSFGGSKLEPLTYPQTDLRGTQANGQ
jgi:hypothetical protein